MQREVFVVCVISTLRYLNGGLWTNSVTDLLSSIFLMHFRHKHTLEDTLFLDCEYIF